MSLLPAQYRRAEPTRRYPNQTVKDGGQMALVDEAGLLRNQSQGLIGVSDQCLRPFKATLDEITLWPDPNSLLERATEVVSAETADRSEFGQRQVSIQMCFDVV